MAVNSRAEFQGRSDSGATAAKRGAAQTVVVLVVVTAAAFTAACGDPAERAWKRWEAVATLRADNAAAQVTALEHQLKEAQERGEGAERAAALLKQAQEAAVATAQEAWRAARVGAMFQAEADLKVAQRERVAAEMKEELKFKEYGALLDRYREIYGAGDQRAAQEPVVQEAGEAWTTSKGVTSAAWERQGTAADRLWDARRILDAALQEATTPEARAFQKAWRRRARGK